MTTREDFLVNNKEVISEFNIYITGNYVLKDMEDKYNASKTKDDNTNVNVIGNRNKKQNKEKRMTKQS